MGGNGHLAARAEGARAHAQYGRGLRALVLAAEDHALDAVNQLGTAGLAQQLGHKALGRAVFGGGQVPAFDGVFEDFVQHRIGRQAVLVLLVGRQLGRGRLVDDGLGNQLSARTVVDVARQLEDLGLVQIAQQAQAAVGVAIQRAVAHRDLGLVARGQQQVAEGVGVLHQRGAADACLQVLQRQALQRLAEAGLELARIAVNQLAYRVLMQRDAQVAAQDHRVIDRAARRKARGHGDGHHVVRAQGLGRQGQGQRAVYAARAANHGAREAAAARIVAQAQHDLAAVELHGGQACGRHAHAGLAGCVEEASVAELQRAQVLHEALGLEDHAAPGLHREGGAVEHDLVLAADLVHVEDGQAVARGRLAEDLVALLALAQVAGAGVDADHQVGRGVGHAREGVGGVVGTGVVPAVLAHQKAHLGLAYAQHLGRVGAGLEVAALVEDVVGGQQLLVVAQAHGAVLEHQQAVVQRLAGPAGARGCADDPVQLRPLARGLQQLLQALLQAFAKGGLVQQVARVVAAQRQLGKDQQVGLRVRGAGSGLGHAGHVAGDVADGGVELGDGDAQHEWSLGGVRRCQTATGWARPKTWRR